MSAPAYRERATREKRGPIKWQGYAMILRGIYDQPSTKRDVAVDNGLNRQSAEKLVRGMHALGLIHRSGWATTAGLDAAVFSAGPGPDASPPLNRDGTPSRHRTHTVGMARPAAELIAFASILRALDEPTSAQGVAEKAGTNPGSTRDLLNLMHDLRMVYVADWDRRLHGGAPAALFMLGFDKPDAPRPKPVPVREIWKRYDQGRRAKARMNEISFALAGARA
jgi:hypothetical protein